MKTKTKLFIVGAIAILGIFANVSPVSAQTFTTTCNTTVTTTTIRGRVLMNGSSSASVWFEWGPNQSLGNTTNRQTFYTDSDFSQQIFGLRQNSTYYYRAMGSNDVGTETGDIHTFNTNCSDQEGDAPTVDIRADDRDIDSGDSTTIRWSSTDADTCRASDGTHGWAGSRNTSGSFNTGDLTDTETYTITCTNENGSADDSVTVDVNDTNENVTVDISANPSSVVFNGSSIITWDSEGADSCRASGGTNGWSGNRSRSGSFSTGSLTRNTSFTISCSNDTDSDSASTTVSVGGQVQNNQPTVVIFADNTNLAFGGSTTVRWNTTNANSCLASGGSLGWAGPKSIGPGTFFTGSLTASRTYIITCTNDVGSATDSVTVGVRGQVLGVTTTNTGSSLVLVTSSVDRNRPIVPTLDNTNPCPGDEINYTITYQNIGTASIKSLALRIDLPMEVDYMFSNPNNPMRSGNTLIFNLGTLKANGQGTVTVRVRVRDNAPAGAPLNFPAILSYIDPSGNPQQVSADVSASVCGATAVGASVIPLGAGVFGAGFLPGNIFGWLLLLILILVLVLLAKYLFNQSFQRRTITTFEQPIAGGRKSTTTTIQQ